MWSFFFLWMELNSEAEFDRLWEDLSELIASLVLSVKLHSTSAGIRLLATENGIFENNFKTLKNLKGPGPGPQHLAI